MSKLNLWPESLLKTISHRPHISRDLREMSDDFPKREVLDAAKNLNSLTKNLHKNRWLFRATNITKA